MANIKENDQETATKRKKRQRVSSVLKNEDKISILQFEESYAEGFMKKMLQKLNNASFQEMLSVLEKFETDTDMKEQFQKMETILKDHEDLQREFLGFLKPHQALECGKLMMYYEICNMKQFIRNLMSHFKRQPHLLRKVVDKLNSLAEQGNIQQVMVEGIISPFLQKNSTLMEQFYKLLPAEKPPDCYFSPDNVWEDLTIDNEVYEEEIFDIPQTINEIATTDLNYCIYNCKNNVKSSLCPICNVKFINGRMYVVNGKMLRPANIIFDPSDESENIKRLCGKNDYFTPTSSKSRTHKRSDTCSKDSNEERLSPLVTGAESEEELGDNELRTSKKRQKNSQRLKVRFKSSKKKSGNLTDQSQAEDTAPSNDEVSCDDTGKEDNGYNSCDDCVPVNLVSDYVALNKEVVQLEDMELNISAVSMPGPSRSRSVEIHKQPKNPKLKVI